jgi:hypothetical protein
VTHRYHAQPIPCYTGINSAVTRRTVAGRVQRRVRPASADPQFIRTTSVSSSSPSRKMAYPSLPIPRSHSGGSES